MRRVVIAAVLLGGAEAFAPGPMVLSRAGLSATTARSSSVPALRMGLGDMLGKAFSNDERIPAAKATGPGSPGFSVEKPQGPGKTQREATTTLEKAAPPPPAVWQEAVDPASGNPYWYNSETGESSWTPPAALPPPPTPVAAAPAPAAAQEVSEDTVIQLQVEEDNGPTGPSLERQLINLNKFLVNGFIDQEEYDEQKKAIQAQMPKEAVITEESLARPFTTTSVKWGALIDTKIPAGWVEQKHYKREGKLDVGSLVGISRSDGTIRFGQIVKPSGLFYEDFWQVVVSMKDDGSPGATRIEEGVMLIRPTKFGLDPVIAAMPKIQVNEKDIGEALTGKKDRGFFGNMFAEPVFEGGSAPSEVPAAPTTAVAPAKAVVPAGIIPGSAPAVPKATIPAGIIPDAAPAPPAPAESETKTSEWI